jgi:hypothetical protein
MDREYTLSEEEKDRALVHYDAILQLKEDRRFQILMEYLKEDAHEAMHKLKGVNPEDPALIREIQNQIWRYEELINKIDFIVAIGEAVKLDRQLEIGD